MRLRLAVGRVGSHIGHLAENISHFGLAQDEQEVTLDVLLDPASLDSLLGKPIVLDHDESKVIGLVDKVVIENNVPYAEGDTLANVEPDTLQVLETAKSEGKPLETSPKFCAQLRLDDAQRVEQYERVYSHIAILSPGTAGRGGKSIVAIYSKEPMDEEMKGLIEGLSAKLDAIASKISEMALSEGTETKEEGAEVEAAYAKGKEDGQMEAEYSLKREQLAKQRGILLEGKTDEEKTANLLKSFDIETSYALSRSVIDTLLKMGVSPVTAANVEIPEAKPAKAPGKAARSIEVKI